MLLIAFFAVELGLSIAMTLNGLDTFFPLGSVSDWLKTLMYLSSLTYLVDDLRGSASIPLAADLSIALGLCASTTALGSYMFSRSEA
jgi:hypothetical protein